MSVKITLGRIGVNRTGVRRTTDSSAGAWGSGYSGWEVSVRGAYITAERR